MKITSDLSGISDRMLKSHESVKIPVIEGETKRELQFIDEQKSGIGQKEIVDAVDKLNKTVRIFNKTLHFELHEESKRWQVQVLNAETGEIIREIPPTEILDIVARIQEAVGLFIDERR